MPKVDIYNIQGKKTGRINLSPAVFAVEINPHLLHQVVSVQMANTKKSTASTKTRGERRGGGVKPWRQKGTGRARAGSIRSPIWRGGGIVFGPQVEYNSVKKIPKKMKQKVILGVLSDKIKKNKIIILDMLEIDKPKTKQMVSILEKLPISESVLLLLQNNNENIKKSARNIPQLKVLSDNSLNIVDLLKYNFLILTKQSVREIEERYKNKS